MPEPIGAWQRDIFGGWSCRVEQAQYGHRARKATWLYMHGCEPLPLRWGESGDPATWISWCGNHNNGKVVKRMGKRERNATPPEFRDALISIARTAHA